MFVRVMLLLLVSLSAVACTANNLQAYNQGMYQANKTIDKYTLKPVARVYRNVIPTFVQNRVHDFFGNVAEVRTFVNSLLQGDLKNAAWSSSRLVWNSTLGIGGLFDVASAMHVRSRPEDFGQTLQVWGMPAGPYLVLPILGPSTVTDALGLAGDFAADPLPYYIKHHYVREGVYVLNAIDRRVQLLSFEKTLQTVAINEYYFVKNAYRERRRSLVSNGRTDSAVDDEFDELFEQHEDDGAVIDSRDKPLSGSE